MTIKKALIAGTLVAILALRCPAQDSSAKPLQGWLDFLVQDASLDSVTHRIGVPDKEKSADYMAPHARMYIWFNRFESDATRNHRLELVAIPDGDPAGSRMIVIAILDPEGRRGIYLPWARRFVDDVPTGNLISNELLGELWD